MDVVLGTHPVRVEGDIVHIQVTGDLNADQFQRLLEIINSVIAQHGRYATIIDTRQMGRLPSETRKLAAGFKGASTCYGNAIFGSNFAVRTVMTMALRTIQILNMPQFPAAWFKTEAEARAWLASRRQAGGKR